MVNQSQNILTTSTLNAFLYSEVGLQTNGAELTILSLLARGGNDPWLQAAEWGRLPRVQAADRLARCIAEMPLCQQALVEAQDTAARLVALLHAKNQVSRTKSPVESDRGHLPNWLLLITILCFTVAIGIAGRTKLAPSAAASGAPTEQSSLFVP